MAATSGDKERPHPSSSVVATLNMAAAASCRTRHPRRKPSPSPATALLNMAAASGEKRQASQPPHPSYPLLSTFPIFSLLPFLVLFLSFFCMTSAADRLVVASFPVPVLTDMRSSSPLLPTSPLFSLPLPLLLLSFFCITSASDVPVVVPAFPVPAPTDIRSSASSSSEHHNHHNPHHDHHDHHFAALRRRDVAKHRTSSWSQTDAGIPDPATFSDRLDLFLVQSAPSWLEVRWQLDNKSGDAVAKPIFSRVKCYLGNTTVIHNIFGPKTQFRIPNLSSSTQYMVCVETLEAAEAKLGHCRCSKFSTIPVVRPDSILGLILTLGYVFLMVLIGYVTWWMRVRKLTANQKHDDDMELSCRTSTIRFSEIEERTHLNCNQSHTSYNSHNS